MTTKMYYTLSTGTPVPQRRRSLSRSFFRLMFVLLVASALTTMAAPAVVEQLDSWVLQSELVTPTTVATVEPVEEAPEIVAPVVEPSVRELAEPEGAEPAPKAAVEVAAPPIGSHLQARVLPPVVAPPVVVPPLVLPTVTPRGGVVLPTVTPRAQP